MSVKKKKEVPTASQQRPSVKAKDKKSKATVPKKKEAVEIVDEEPVQELSDSESENDEDNDQSSDGEFLPSDSEEEEYRPSYSGKGKSSVSTRKSSRKVAKRSQTDSSESSKDSSNKLGKRLASEKSVDNTSLPRTKTPRIAISPVKISLAKKMSLSPLKKRATSKQVKKPIKKAKEGAGTLKSVQIKIPVASYPPELGYQ